MRLWLVFQICTLLEQRFVSFGPSDLISVKTLGFLEGSIIIYHGNFVQSARLGNVMKRALCLVSVLGGISYEQVILSRERHLSKTYQQIAQAVRVALGSNPKDKEDSKG